MIHQVSKVHVLYSKSSTADVLSEKFEALFPTWTTVVATLIALIILLIILTKLFYKPVKKMHDERKDYIQHNIDSAESQNEEAVSDREKANDELIQARILAAKIVNQANEDAELVKVDKLAMAKISANKVIEDANSNIEAQQAKFDEESEKAIIEVAMAAAAKVIEKEVDNNTNRKIVENYIKAKK